MAGILVLARFTDGWARTAFLFYDTRYAGLDWPMTATACASGSW